MISDNTTYGQSDATSCSRALRWTPDDLKTLRLLAGKIPAKEIARILNRGLPTIHVTASANGIELAMPGEAHHGAKYSDEKVEIARRIKESIPVLSCAQIGRILGVPDYTVRDWCNFVSRRNDPVKLP
jgi:hypothetical protein